MQKTTSKTKELNNTLGTISVIFFIIFLCMCADSLCGNVEIEKESVKPNLSTIQNY
jgi:hypothetical protein